MYFYQWQNNNFRRQLSLTASKYTQSSYRDSRRLVQSALGNGASNVVIHSGSPNAEKTYWWCSNASVVMNSVVCRVIPMDSHGNEVDAASNIGLFSLATTPTTGEVVKSSVDKNGYIAMEFVRNDTGRVSVQIKLNVNNNIEDVRQPVDIFIVSGKPHSVSVSCPSTAINSSVISCTISVQDKHGNPTGDTIQDILTNLTVSTSAPVAVLSSRDAGIFYAKFNAPPNAGETISVTSSFTSEVIPIKIISGKVTSLSVFCPPSSVAGAFLRCNVNTKNLTGHAAGDAPDANSLKIKINGTDGRFVTKVANSFAGEHLVELSVWITGTYRMTIEYPGVDQVATTEFKVVAGEVSGTASKVVCPSSFVILSSFKCTVYVKDSAGNPPATNISTAALSQTLLVNGATLTHGKSAYVSGGKFNVNFFLNTTGFAVIKTYYGGNLIGQDQPIEILPGPVVSSVLQCPGIAVLNSSVECHLYTKDTHGRPSETGVSNFTKSISSASGTAISTNPSSVLGTSLVSFQLPAHTTTLTITYGKSAQQQTHITVVSSEVSAEHSNASCLSSITAGSVFSCVIVGKDKNMHVAGEALDARAFTVMLKNMNLSSQSEFSAAFSNVTGEFKAKKLVTTSGLYEVTVMFAGKVVLHKQTVNVMAGDINKGKISLSCPTNTTTGDQTDCSVIGRDSHNNFAGSGEDASRFSGLVYNVGTATVMKTKISFSQKEPGRFLLRYVSNFSDVGDVFNVVVFYLGEKVASRTVQVVKKTDSIHSEVFYPSPSASPSPSPSSSSVCVTRNDIFAACVKKRGKWAFTCKQSAWKRGGMCPDSTTAFDESMGECVDVCS
jgi:hypothetical protein